MKISPAGEVITLPEPRSFAEIRQLQNECTTLVVETSASVSFFDLELPWLSETKARTAIPYALEDKLAQPVEALHFAFDKLRYHNNHYLVSVIEKQRLHYVMKLLDEHQIEFNAITPDWFALAPHELCITESLLLVNNEDYKGALSDQLAITYIKKHPFDPPLLFNDSQLLVDSSLPRNAESSHVWIAKKLLRFKPLNLCQGGMQHGNTLEWLNKGYKLVGLLCVGWLFSLLLVNALSLYSLNKKINTTDQQIALIYQEFFPGAKQVISPKFRINQLLGNDTSGTESRFWFLLNHFAQAIKESGIATEQLRYQNKTLFVTVISPDFASLERIENTLKKLNLNVKQTQASTREQQVVATLELM